MLFGPSLSTSALGCWSEPGCGPRGFQLLHFTMVLAKEKKSLSLKHFFLAWWFFFVAILHSVAWGICRTLKRHICSFTLASVKLGRHMFSLFSPPVRSLKRGCLSDSALIPQVVVLLKSLVLESSVLINLAGNNYKVWLESQCIGILVGMLNCPA